MWAGKNLKMYESSSETNTCKVQSSASWALEANGEKQTKTFNCYATFRYLLGKGITCNPKSLDWVKIGKDITNKLTETRWFLLENKNLLVY